MSILRLQRDFAILFLPFESIYAEVIRRTSLVETLQKDYKIVVTGPTTLGAILNSLQMGFRTLAIQKRTGEVWTVLGAVKTEFGKFGGLLEKVQKNLQSAGDQLEGGDGKTYARHRTQTPSGRRTPSRGKPENITDRRWRRRRLTDKNKEVYSHGNNT